jgi:hypothetical protein
MGFAMTKKGYVLGGGAYVQNGKTEYALAVINLDVKTPVAERLPLPFLAHGIAIDPNCAQRAVLFEKKGPGACLVDLGRRQMVRPLPTQKNRHYYGHGAFSSDGARLYATESLLDRDFEGALVVRDGKTLRELGTLPTYGAAPHDCTLIDGGKTMVVTNGGGPLSGAAPSVVYIDLESEKLLERVPIPASRVNAGHVAISQAGDLAIVSAPREGLSSDALGAVTLRPVGKPPHTIARPHNVTSRMVGETLSVAINERDRTVLATHPLGDCVSVWRLDDASFVELYETYNPRGIALTLDKAWTLISHTTEDSVRITVLCAESRRPIGVHVDPSFTSGSHLFVHDLAA